MSLQRKKLAWRFSRSSKIQKNWFYSVNAVLNNAYRTLAFTSSPLRSTLRTSEMAEKDASAVGCQRSVQRGLEAPSAGQQGVLQDAGLGFTPLDSKEDGAVQPFPRSPKLLRKLAKVAAPSQVNKCGDANTEEDLRRRDVRFDLVFSLKLH